MMRTRPKPSDLYLVAGPYRRIVHLGYRESGRERILCHTKADEWAHGPQYPEQGVVNCNYCIKRLRRIELMIEKLGVEWVCEGYWKPFPERVFEDRCRHPLRPQPPSRRGRLPEGADLVPETPAI